MAIIKKTIKTIKIDADKCNGCRTCEVVCSAVHASPKYSSVNPADSRIHVITHRLNDIWLPVFAGEYTPAECNGRDQYIIDGKEYDECSFCRATCPSRNMFKEPGTGLPLKCDMCEEEDRPLCVEWCLNDVLIYEEREEEVDQEIEPDELAAGLDSLIDKFGREKTETTFARLLQNR
ncbi:(4Fe-4S)-binding protein [Desulfospira joergensenii]|uniref:(4Fe-4S)-binding protein n=1 Tax=Desulfospira joergensenii TaxID=53329 RepID=UPI0003B56BEE|nr:(4Fe-4S)-binding protein [Desulfospira joergensenii]